jgi:hypothetical protein
MAPKNDKPDHITLRSGMGPSRHLVEVADHTWELRGDLRLLRTCYLSDSDHNHLRFFDPFGGPLVAIGTKLVTRRGRVVVVREIGFDDNLGSDCKVTVYTKEQSPA